MTEIKLLMARRGYDTTEMNSGQALLTAANAAQQAAGEAAGDAAFGSQAAQEAEAAETRLLKREALKKAA